ncbi:TrlF family AAA-like ATPase [Paenibacillus alvei]|uniref:TrlF family AAA-like ATPase n=1 Tax=Paenibacillus alvei TaxID=44250 RepID=UPI00227FFB20|nr:AAA family ATPase [Paenibacillus alvei]
MSYKGMRWYKCDFQMQTPGDPNNWLQSDPAYLKKKYSQEELIKSVDLYLTRCHEVGLEVVCITEHNFIGIDYLRLLKSRNTYIANQLQKQPLVIFPGFEVEISQGLGIHLLCIFEENKPLHDIDDIVTQLGLPRSERVRNGNIVPLPQVTFDRIQKIVQEDYNGVIIAAHPLSYSGLLNDDFLTEFFQRDMFLNPKLLALELPKPLADFSSNMQKLIIADVTCHAEWRRERRIAAVMSSDAYSLYEDSKGYIGKRHTWVKMSHPSLESVIQAFLDCERIELTANSPGENVKHDRIVSLSMENVAFLEDQTIHLSPHLNCIIGGRGSGKSSILEYIRLAVSHKQDIRETEQIQRVRRTLLPTSVIRLTWEGINGLSDTFEYDVASQTAKIIGREAQDPATVLRNLKVQVFSQREISEIAQEQQSLSNLIDIISGSELDRLKSKETELISTIQNLFQFRKTMDRLKNERNTLLQEISEIQRQWNAFVSVQAENERRNKAIVAENYIREISEESKQLVASWEQQIKSFSREHADLVKQDWLDDPFFDNLNVGLGAAKQELVKNVKAAVVKYSEAVDSLTEKHEKWEIITQAIQQTKTDFISACQEKGIHPDQIEVIKGLEQSIRLKEQDLDEKEKRLANSSQEIEKLYTNIGSLHDNWLAQTTLKIEKINSILASGSIPFTQQGSPFIAAEIFKCRDQEHFKQIWSKNHNIRGNTRLGRIWDSIGEKLYQLFEVSEDLTPWTLLEKWLENAELMPSELRGHHGDLKAYLTGEGIGYWETMQLTRINDRINITLYRDDGTRAGSLDDKGLSDGQKNTAILALLFAHGTNPIIIDQPEDELDSDFIYNQLVPLLRRVKHNRQIILATHNANIPVNGDCELLYALNTEMGKGILKAEGGLEKPHVKEAVLNIMEGSREAFRRRQEKYSF